MKFKGTIKYFNQTKGYGFIAPDNKNDKDVFVHISDFQDKTLAAVNNKVTYDVYQGKKGIQAKDVELDVD